MLVYPVSRSKAFSYSLPIYYTAPVVVPSLSYYAYENLNARPDIIVKAHNRFWRMFYEEWLISDRFSDILSLVNVTGSSASLVKSVNDAKHPDPSKNNLKINFILQEIFDEYRFGLYLENFTAKYDVKWYDLMKHIISVKKYIHKIIKKIMLKKINKSK